MSPRPLAGALVGLMLSTALYAILYLAEQVAGLPFTPFLVFDWLTRILPGALLTKGIDTLVGSIHALDLGQTSSIAKLAEQTMAVASLLIAGAIAAAVLFALVRRSSRSAAPLGMAIGLFFGCSITLIDASGPTIGRAVDAVWIIGTYFVWGAALGWVNDRLRVRLMVPAHRVADSSNPFARAAPIDRRRFMIRLGEATAVITVAGAGVGGWLATMRERSERPGPMGRWSEWNPLPNSEALVKPVPGTRPEFTRLEDHYRVDINTRPPVIAESEWRLRIGGLVEQPREFALEELRGNYAPLHQFITLSCISNPIAGDLIGTTRWSGVPLQDLIAVIRPRPEATYLEVRSADGFHEMVSLQLISAERRIMLTYAWDGLPLAHEHGFPLRIYIPDRYGMKQPKWITEINATDEYADGYWVERGWDREALMRATSVIDTVGTELMTADAAGTRRLPIGGIAHAGARGISRVEIQADGRGWETAQLRDPLSRTTWVIWRYDWPFAPGEHTFTVRCFDGNGAEQIVTPAPEHPSGATGLHSRSVRV